ncbi:DUF3237 domain-containing protein [Sphingosinithalassobacter sp. CS137]|uniref:DUF3237 domain-containing protein n=1 Tax=Sphingosinithalassobacter sp. CS137 TaxID=2762748 RepID=UPI00165E09E8|nr:DUF3237 domain-containing protein [Sphingosinithalassobacter sp. CS137]
MPITSHFGLALAGLAAAASLAGSASAQSAPPAPPGLTYAFSVRVEVAPPIEQGEIDGGRRRFIPITGGTISGPRLTGTVASGGGDWQTIYPGGFTRIEARYFLKAEDGTLIGIHNPGVRVADETVTQAIARGEQVPPASYYFRSSPVFDPPPGPHQWLREKTFVGRGIRMPDHVVIEFFIVE